MSILIRSMEMPKDDEMLCINIYPDGRVCIDMDLQCKPVAQAVELPPHGRLIDADVIETELWSVRRGYQLLDDTQTADKIMTGIFRAERLLKDAPTIIEAGDGE